MEIGSNIFKTQTEMNKALIAAVSEGDSLKVGQLITAKADVNFVENGGYTVLMDAAARGSSHIVARLLAAGANVNFVSHWGETALLRAVYYAKRSDSGEDIVVQLLTAGAKVDSFGSDSKTALIIAAEFGAPHIVARLLAAGANVNLVDGWGRTALLAAADSETIHNPGGDTITQLLTAGAKVDSFDNEGRTALIAAAARGFSYNVDRLLDADADVSIVDKSGRTAARAAVRYNEPMNPRLLAASMAVTVDKLDAAGLHGADVSVVSLHIKQQAWNKKRPALMLWTAYQNAKKADFLDHVKSKAVGSPVKAGAGC